MAALKPQFIGLATYSRARTTLGLGVKPEMAKVNPFEKNHVVGAAQRTYLFALGSDGNLYLHHWNGFKWQWSNQGHPPAGGFVGQASGGVSAVTYRADGMEHVWAFAAQGTLYANHWDGTDWHWLELGAPTMPAGTLVGTINAIAYEENGQPKLHAFCQGSLDWRHFVKTWNGSQWAWHTLGMHPKTQGSLGGPSAVTFEDPTGNRAIYTFASSGPAANAIGRLYVNKWDGSTWQWADHGTPGTEPGAWPSVVTYRDGDIQRIYAFLASASHNPDLIVNYWNGSKWQWSNLGRPPGARIEGRPEALTYLDGSTQRIDVFVPCGSQHQSGSVLCICRWNGVNWQWSEQGVAPQGIHRGTVRAMSMKDGKTQHIYAFFIGGDGHLWRHHWNGSKWQWADHGAP